MTELEYVIKHGGLTPKRLLKKITRRGFGASVLSGLAGAAASRLVGAPSAEAAGADFTIAIIPDPQYLAEACPDNLGGHYAGMMKWIVDNKNIAFRSGASSFDANIKAVVGVGDCVNQTAGDQYTTRTALHSLRLRGTTTIQADPIPGISSERNSQPAISPQATALRYTAPVSVLAAETWLTGLDLTTVPEPTQR